MECYEVIPINPKVITEITEEYVLGNINRNLIIRGVEQIKTELKKIYEEDHPFSKENVRLFKFKNIDGCESIKEIQKYVDDEHRYYISQKEEQRKQQEQQEQQKQQEQQQQQEKEEQRKQLFGVTKSFSEISSPPFSIIQQNYNTHRINEGVLVGPFMHFINDDRIMQPKTGMVVSDDNKNNQGYFIIKEDKEDKEDKEVYFPNITPFNISNADYL
jgi:hypothetical protein